MKVSRNNGVTRFEKEDGTKLSNLRLIVKEIIDDKSVMVSYEDVTNTSLNIILTTGSIETILTYDDHLCVGSYSKHDSDISEDLESYSKVNVEEMIMNIVAKYNHHLKKIDETDFDEFVITKEYSK